MITWIEGQNTTGKTIFIKKLLGATFPLKDFAPLDIIKEPLDIENDFPNRLIPSDFVFYYNISMPEHIMLTIGNSQVHVFLEKVRGKARERNKIFQVHNKFLTQNTVIREKENDIKELEDRIQSIHDQYREEYCQWQVTKKELEEKIKKFDEITAEIDKIFAVPEFRRYHELIEDYIKSKHTKKESEDVYKPLWNKLKRYKEIHTKIVKSLGEREDVLFKEKESIGKWFDLIEKLEELEKHRPGIPFTHHMNYRLDTSKRNLKKYKSRLVTKEEIIELIKNFSLKKSIWIDGKPSTQFKDFHDLIEIIKTLSPEELFISHCGNKMWFQQSFKAVYHTRDNLSLNLNDFKAVWIEVPSMDEKVTLNKQDLAQCL